MSFAQGSGSDFFRNIGKIYVVVAVVAATFIGIVIFLIYLERKINKIENEISSHK
jgi:CcmD family protein